MLLPYDKMVTALFLFLIAFLECHAVKVPCPDQQEPCECPSDVSDCEFTLRIEERLSFVSYEINKDGTLGERGTLYYKDNFSFHHRGIVDGFCSYVVISFQADNPGYWFMHCHVEEHLLDGMALLIQEYPDSQHWKPPAGINNHGSFQWTIEDFNKTILASKLCSTGKSIRAANFLVLVVATAGVWRDLSKFVQIVSMTTEIVSTAAMNFFYSFVKTKL